MTITASRYHDFSAGHRVYGHESKCAGLHGHNYRVTFDCSVAKLDALGRVVDFSVIKSTLCDWLEEHWDHKFMLWMNDPMLPKLRELSPESVVSVTFNPTAENMALYLLHSVGPHLMAGTGVALLRVKVEETRKCSASAEL